MKSYLEEFKAFAMKGNVVDLAVAVVIGTAFGRIVSSLVDDIIMPLIGVATGGVDFSELAWTIKEASGDAAAVTLNYGSFINTVVTFIIIAFVIFSVIKLMNRLEREKEQAPASAPELSTQEKLLTEIRDFLKK